MLRLRPLAFLVCLLAALCLLGLLRARSQTNGLRRVTTTTGEGININPSLSGDGRRISFESTEDLAHAGGSDHFRAIRADLASDPVVFTQLAGTRAPAPGISQDGSRIAFAATDDPLGTNPDSNSEIFFFDSTTLRQITNTTPNDIATRTRDGNFQPSLTDDGRFIAFSSNRNLSSQNPDGNLEIFIYDTAANTFTQLTNTAGPVGASDAKISGDGTRVAYIRDNNASPSTQRDLILQDRTGGTTRLIASNVLNLAFTYGRAISDDGSRVVYSADIATDSSQVFLYDGRTSNTTRQITALGVRTTEVPLHPTISGNGTRLAFATRRPIIGFSNTDNSIELYTYDIPTGQFERVTNAPSSADGFDGSNRAAEVVSSLNDDGSIVAFNFPRSLSGAVASGLENNSEIYVTATAVRPTVGTLTVLNGASFGNEPSTTKAIAPDSYAVALGGALSFTAEQSSKQANGTFPTTVGGTNVTVNGRRAQIFFVSPTRVDFLVPRETELGTATVIVTNAEGFQSRGTVTVLRAAPGIFTTSGDGTGEAVVLNAQTGTPGPFDPTSGNLGLVIFATGVRNALQITVTASGRALTIESVTPSQDMPGFDEVRVLVPSDLRGAGTVDLVIRADNRDSNPATIVFSGTPRNDIVINEVLADPPDDLAGDANHDGVRSSSDDEFVEIVNATQSDIDISGFTLSTRSTGGASDTPRHMFAPGTIFNAGSAIVVFGGGNFNPNDPVFGGARVLKASSGGLSLTNSGGVVTLRDNTQSIVNIFSYGGSTGLDADNNQSLTRSPDINGSFTPHTTAQGSNGRAYSPGTHVDGSPFTTIAIARIDVSPPSATIGTGAKQQFTAQAFDQFGHAMTGATITFASDNTSVATVDSVTTDPSTGIATATVTGHNPGTAHIIASATDDTTTVTSSQATLTVNAATITYSVSGRVKDASNNPISGVLITFDMDFQGTTTTRTTTTDANGNYSSGDLGCQNSVRVTPSKAGLTFTPSSTIFVNSSQCLSGNDVVNFTGATLPPGTLVISQLYVGGGNASATYTNDFVEIFNSGTTTVDFSQTPYSIQYVGTTGTFGSTSAANKTNITSGAIAPGQYFLVQEASGGANGIALPTPDATGSINMAATGGKVALVVGTAALPAFTCPGDDGASPFNPINSSIADFVGYGGSATTTGHCYEGLAPAPAPGATTADFRKGGGCVDTNFNGDDFLTGAVSPRNTSFPLNDCSTGIKPEITINDPAAVSESAANATFTVTLSTPSTLTVTLDYATANGTAIAGTDYQSTSGTLTFAPGETTKSINVPIINDTIDEPSETFFVNLTNASTATILDNQGQGTITDNDTAPTISINDTSIAEGNGGTTNATFTVTLSAASGFTVTVNYATTDGSATAGSDYQSTSGTLTFNPGQTTQTIIVPVNGDTTFEQDETFFINLTTPSNATISDNQGLGTVTNDDAAPPLPAISINDVSIAEGNSGTKTLDFTVSLSISSTETITVDYATANGTATASSDYQSTSGTVTFNPGETSKPVSITINGDTLVEPDETFFVNLTNASAGAIISDNQGTGMIQNDDTPLLVISQVYGGGNNSGASFRRDFIELFNRGTTIVDFSVTPYSVQYASAGSPFGSSKTDLTSGTIAPGHYFLIQESGGTTNGAPLPTPNATGTIAMGNTSGKVALVTGTASLPAAICPGDDGVTPFNPNDTAIVDFIGYGSISCYEGAGPAPAPSNTTADFRKAGGCTDTDNNATDFLVATPNPRNTSSPVNNCAAGSTPNLSISDATVTEGNSGTVIATFTVSLNAPAQGADVTFDIATADGTATIAGNDYVAKSLTNQVIPAGQQTYTFTVIVNGDTNVEPDETFFVNVTNVAGANLTDGQGVGTIQNDDLPTLSLNDVSLNEGNAGTTTFTFTVHLSAPAVTSVTFDIATADGTAQDGNAVGEDNDYQANGLTAQTIPAGQQDYQFAVTVIGDANIEANETFFVNVTNVSGATITDGQGTGMILNDDSPTLSITDVSMNEGNGGTTTFTFTVNLSQPAPMGGVTFDIATQDGTATVANNDYVARSLSGQMIPEGQQTYTFDVTVNGDKLVEPNETFFVNLSNAANANITDLQGVGTITNDDTPNLVISQLYGAGGNGGATYQNDFIEIFNRGTTTVDFSLTPYSLQYAAAGSNFGASTSAFKFDITSGTIAPGKYFLIKLAGGANGIALPTADATGSIAMAATAGKIALVKGVVTLPSAACPSDPSIVDLVGYGSSATCSETSPAPAPSTTNSIQRAGGGCTDHNNNSTDFTAAPVAPRNSNTAANICP